MIRLINKACVILHEVSVGGLLDDMGTAFLSGLVTGSESYPAVCNTLDKLVQMSTQVDLLSPGHGIC